VAAANRSLVTQSVVSPVSIDALRKVYSVTSSAATRRAWGTVMPRALAAIADEIIKLIWRGLGTAPAVAAIAVGPEPALARRKTSRRPRVWTQ
jgi:hypothetical protein